MKISKVFAGLLAMAVAATTAISASAASTITVNNPEPTDWGAAFPKWTVEGGSDEMDDYIDAKTFTKGTEMTVKVTFEYTSTFTEAEEGNRYAILKPCHAAQGWKSLMDEGYVSGLVEKGDWDYAEIGYTKKDGSGTVPYVSQGDNIVTNDPNNTTIEFTISADGVDAMIAAATASDSAYDGIQIQEYGLDVKSIELSQDGVQLSSQYSGGESKGDVSTDSTAGSDGSDNKPGSASTDKSGSTSTDKTGTTGSTDTAGSTGKSGGSTSTGKSGGSTGSSSSDNTANTGATTGLALAGLALAGAAFVVSKKK